MRETQCNSTLLTYGVLVLFQKLLLLSRHSSTLRALRLSKTLLSIRRAICAFTAS